MGLEMVRNPMGFYKDNGEENGNYYIIVGYILVGGI